MSISVKRFNKTSGVTPTDEERVIFMDSNRDSGSIVLSSDELPFPDQPLSLMDSTKFKRIGVEPGWVGYPPVAPSEFCFFTGCMSSFVTELVRVVNIYPFKLFAHLR